MKIKTSALALLCLAFAASAFAQTTEAPKPNDYSADASWLCRPGKKDACAVDLNTTIVKADGSFAREDWKGDPNAPIDCFYVYPTDRRVASTRHSIVRSRSPACARRSPAVAAAPR